jgi:soluble lytic murein transglycosylase-like protein
VKTRFLLLLALLSCSGIARADIYRFLNSDGRIVYTDIPPADRPFEVVAKSPVPAAASPAVSQPVPEAAPESIAAAPGLPLGEVVPQSIPAAQRPALGETAAFKRSRYAVHIQEAARVNNLDPALLHAVIRAESGYNPGAISPKGAVGLMQLMPETARRYSVRNRWDPLQNIHGGARYLSDLLRLFNNDLRLAVAAYNAGEQAVMKHGNRIPPYAETMAYVPRVLTYYRKYRGIH